MSKSINPKSPDDKSLDSAYIKKQNEVFDDYLKGIQNYNQLAKRHNISRADAVQMVESVKDYFRQSGVFKAMASERLAEMDRHYTLLIKEGWDAIEEMRGRPADASKIATTIKAIADIEAKRQDSLQKAGFYEDDQIGDMLAEAEVKIEAIQTLLKQIITKYPAAKQDILNGLRDIQNPGRLKDPDVIDGEVL